MKRITKWIDEKELEDKIAFVNPYTQEKNFQSRYQEVELNEDIEDVIIKDIIENDYIICGDTYQSSCIPIFDNSYYIEISMRKWGEIMAQARNLKDNPEPLYTYRDFYLNSLCSMKEKLPDKNFYSSNKII